MCGDVNVIKCDALVMYRARRSEARIQQMLWKVNYSDIVFINTVWLCKINCIRYDTIRKKNLTWTQKTQKLPHVARKKIKRKELKQSDASAPLIQ